MSVELSEEQRQRALDHIKKVSKRANEDGGANGRTMSAEDCQHVRSLARDGLRPSTIARRDEVKYTVSAVREHIRGACRHASTNARWEESR
jgi:hypothetical protein